MSTTSLSPPPKLQFFDANGDPLVGGLLYTYEAGTTTPLATYTDSTGVSLNTNPITLDSRGEANVWLGTASYKLALYTSAGVLIWTVDNISTTGSNLPVTDHTGDGTTTVFAVSDGFTAIYINGVYQNRNTYTATSGTVTFSQAPPYTSIIEVVYN
tara:strand:+ start:1458 stop:1925 length:468 start_codon:yes stop_codon:yes gene_type:complete